MTSTPDDGNAFEAVIVSACAEHERVHYWEKSYRRCLVIGGHFVKFDSYNSLYSQFETQKYVFQCSKGDVSAPRVPEVLQFFHRDYMAYMVERLARRKISRQCLQVRRLTTIPR